MAKYYTWKYQLEIPPYDKVIEVLEAFFASYPGGDYACETREKFKLEFRRGAWKRPIIKLGEYVPDKLIPGKFDKWPLIVRVMVRPSPAHFTISVHYEVHLPKSVPSLSTEVQSSVDAHIKLELEDLSRYLAECVGSKDPPQVVAM